MQGLFQAKAAKMDSRESSSFHDLAGGTVVTRVAVAGVDDGFAVLAVEAGGADALVVAARQRPARGTVLARVVLTEVALGKDPWVNVT